MEGAIGRDDSDSSAFKECLTLAWKNPYVLRLAFSAGIGGLLFGYDTGVISGALLYIRDDFSSVDKKTVLQESIVSMAVAGANIGAAVGGWANDRFGRRTTILVADFLFFIGAVMMASAPNPAFLIVGRVFVGFGVGMASMTAPLYISEASPTRVRGALAPGTWRWMLGVAAVPALLQFFLMLLLPESPRWLYRKGRIEESIAILRKIYSSSEVQAEIGSLATLVDQEIKQKEKSEKIDCMKLIKSKTIRRGLIAGVGLQIFQQFVGINTVMYYSPTIVQLAGFASNQTALMLSLITSGLNAFGSIVSIYFVDRTGRKKLLIISLLGVILSLGVLTAVFHETTTHSPNVSNIATTHFSSYACPAYHGDLSWDCTKCLKEKCGFCASNINKRLWYTRGCPSRYGWLALVGLALYIIFFPPGMGIPWIVNSEIYPLRFRSICGGIAATANWISNLIVAYSLSLTQAIGTAWTFMLFGFISVIALIFVLMCVPETKGLPIEEVEKMLEKWSINFSCFT